MIRQDKQHIIIIGLILITGFMLRFWHYFSIPFTYDELSALYRLRFGSLLEVIKQGVFPDGHPAGVQVFLWFWTKWVGTAEYLVKLPFLFLGMASILLTYQIGRIWFGKTTGILAAAYISSLQMFVMYSQIARPYSSGLFFCLLMVYFWSRYFFESNKTGFLIGFVFSASMATYNHHFSLLFAAIVGLSGLFLVRKKNLIPYLISGVAIFILYIPHLPIFFSQLHQGGIGGVGGWLNKPGPNFLLLFLDWLFHYSFWVFGIACCLVIFLFSAHGKAEDQKSDNRKRVVLLTWFLLPIIIGYLYSVFINPVLQYSLLIFSTPYLFILFFSIRKEIPLKLITVMVSVILLANSLTLIFKREYYHVFYRQPFEEVVKEAVKIEKEHPGDVYIIDDYVPFYNEYYFRKYRKEIPYYTVRNKEITLADFKKMLTGIKQNYIVTSGLDPKYFQLIKEQFPYLFGVERGFTFEQYLFSKQKIKGIVQPEYKLIAQLNLSGSDSLWHFEKDRILFDSTDERFVYEFKSDNIYGLRFQVPLTDITRNIFQFIDIEAEIKTNDSILNSSIVAEIKNDDKLLYWNATNFNRSGIKPGVWQKVYLTVDLQNAMHNKNKISQGDVFKTYLWNKGQNQFFVKEIKIYLRPGNTYRYALFYDIDH